MSSPFETHYDQNSLQEDFSPSNQLQRPPNHRRHNVRPWLPALWFLISLLGTLVGALYLFHATVIAGLTAVIISLGLDPLRSQFIAALIMTGGSALVGCMLGRRKSGASIGAGLGFGFAYLMGFIQSERAPVYDPGGLLEPLNSNLLVHTSLTMMALALLSAFIGSAIGKALGEVLLDPPYKLARLVWQHFVPRISEVQPPASTGKFALVHMIGSWLGVGAIIVLFVLASDATNLFLFSPDINLHTAPKITSSGGTVLQDSLISSALKGQRKDFKVYLPPSYNTSRGENRRYPTLYLLHGSPGKDIDWFTGGKASQSADTLIEMGKIPELIIISPDGNGRPGATSEWGNSADGQQMIETYVATNLVKYVDQHYRTLADTRHRAIGGLSMGGFGAMNIAVHHPDIFGTVISLGGYYRAEGSIWGKKAPYIQQNSPLVALPSVRQAWQLHVFLGAATKDQPYYTDTEQFALALEKLHIPYHFDLQIGYHSWRVWQVQMYNALLWLRWG